MSRRPNPSRIEVGTDEARILLNGGGIAIVDLADVEKVSGYAWLGHPNGSGNLYASSKVSRKTIYLHRLIMGLPDGLFVDHVNGDGLDCRRSNLRSVTTSQNQMNRRTQMPFKGVYKHDLRNLWYAKIRKKKHGYFKTPEEAALAYDAAARLAYGEFARCNFESHGCSV